MSNEFKSIVNENEDILQPILHSLVKTVGGITFIYSRSEAIGKIQKPALIGKNFLKIHFSKRVEYFRITSDSCMIYYDHEVKYQSINKILLRYSSNTTLLDWFKKEAIPIYDNLDLKHYYFIDVENKYDIITAFEPEICWV